MRDSYKKIQFLLPEYKDAIRIAKTKVQTAIKAVNLTLSLQAKATFEKTQMAAEL